MIRKIAFLAGMMVMSQAVVAGGAVHWGYDGEAGPANWGKLAPEFRMCGEGRNQSPVDITAAVDAQLPSLQMQEKVPVKALVNNGHTVKAEVAAGGELQVDGKRFALKQFHFHAPSENTLNGKHFPMEIHFVHAADDGALAVIGVFVKEGAENAALARLWQAMPAKAGDKTAPRDVQAAALLPEDGAYYRFNGSLTTPPCSEGVVWLVMKQPIEASAAQIEAFRKVMGHANNRPVQPLNARLVLE